MVCSLSRDARWYGALHIDEHFTDPAGDGGGRRARHSHVADKGGVLLHPHVRIKPNYCDTGRGGALVGEVKKRSAVTLSLCARPHCDAVDRR